MAIKILKEFFHMLFYIVLILFTSYLISHFVVQKTVVIGSSMEKTLSDGDNLIVNRFSYHFIKPKRFDIISFQVEDDNYIKRIIGLPGETIWIHDGKIYINGEELEESYGSEPIAIGNEGRAKEAFIIGKNEYFVLGDNRNHSTDSRDETVGNIARSTILGEAEYRIWPYEKIGKLD